MSEGTHTHDFQHIVTATAQAVILILQQQGIMPAPASGSADINQLPQTPAGEPALHASTPELWRGDREALSLRECNQLAVIASSYDSQTGGFGAYWLGRAIILADLCLRERGHPLSLSYVRSMLRRWAQEGSWGSDLAGEHAGNASIPPRPQLRSPQVQPAYNDGQAAKIISGVPSATEPAEAAPVAAEPEHPAIAAYRAAFGRMPNRVQAQQIAATVADLARWQRVLTDWQANGWQAGAVAKMVDRYDKDGRPAAAPLSEPAPSVVVVHTYPGLNLDQRAYWIRKFHSETTPAGKRAVLARLEQEHPR